MFNGVIMKSKIIATLVAGTMAFSLQAENMQPGPSVGNKNVADFIGDLLPVGAIKSIFGRGDASELVYSKEPLMLEESLNDRFLKNSEFKIYSKSILKIKEENLVKKIDIVDMEISEMIIKLKMHDIEFEERKKYFESEERKKFVILTKQKKYDYKYEEHKKLIKNITLKKQENIQNTNNLDKTRKQLKSIKDYDPNIDFLAIYEASIYLNNKYSIEKMEAHLTLLRKNGDQFFVDKSGFEHKTNLETIKEMKQQLGLFGRYFEYFDNKYRQVLDENLNVKWSIKSSPTMVILHKNNDLYDMKLLNLKTGMENSETMEIGYAIAKNGYPIEICSFYQGSDKYYEFSKDQLVTIGALAGNYSFDCIDSEKLNYFSQRRKDFVGVLGHWIVPK